MEPLDGNAIAGELLEHFGAEMTEARGRCTECGGRPCVAELLVYVSGPGAVARCPACGSVALVVVSIRGEARVSLGTLEL